MQGLGIRTNYGRVTPLAVTLCPIAGAEVEAFLHPHLQWDLGPLHVIKDGIFDYGIIIEVTCVQVFPELDMIAKGPSKRRLASIGRSPQDKVFIPIRFRVTLLDISSDSRHDTIRKIDGWPRYND